MQKNKDNLVGIYNYISRDQNCDIMTELYLSDFNTLSIENWFCNFILNIKLLSYVWWFELEKHTF